MPEITWKCVSCGFDIEDGEGWVHVPMSELHEHETAVDEWRDKNRPKGTEGVSVGQLMDFPDEAHWQPVHEVCDASGGEPYALDVEELRTPWDLVEKTAHLMGKTWLPSTDWDDVLRAKHEEASRNEGR